MAVVLQSFAMKQTRLANNLRRLRGERSQDALATEAGLDRCTINRIERGHTADPGSKTLSALAGALGVTVDELLREPDVEPKRRASGGRR